MEVGEVRSEAGGPADGEDGVGKVAPAQAEEELGVERLGQRVHRSGDDVGVEPQRHVGLHRGATDRSWQRKGRRRGGGGGGGGGRTRRLWMMTRAGSTTSISLKSSLMPLARSDCRMRSRKRSSVRSECLAGGCAMMGRTPACTSPPVT